MDGQSDSMSTKPVICTNCKIKFYKPERLIIKRNFCSKKCFLDFKRRNPQFYKKSYQTDAMKKLIMFAEIRKKNKEVKGRQN